MLDKLPVEILYNIISFLPLSDRAKLRQVNQLVKQVAELTLKKTNCITYLKHGHEVEMSPCDSWNKFVSISYKDVIKFGTEYESFLTFLNNYCGDSIELHMENFYQKNYPEKLKFLYCKIYLFSDSYDLESFKYCPKFEGMKDPSTSYIKYLFEDEDDQMLQELFKLGVERSFTHLVLPENSELQLPLSLKSLDITFDTFMEKKLPDEIMNSLIELRIISLDEIDSLIEPVHYDFPSLKRLSLYTNYSSKLFLETMVKCLEHNFEQLESLELDNIPCGHSDFIRLPSICNNLRQIRIFFDGSVEFDEIELNFIQPHLERITMRSHIYQRKMAVNIMSKKIKYIYFKLLTLTDLNVDHSNLRYLKIKKTEIEFDLASKIEGAICLKELHLIDIILDHAFCVRLINQLTNLNHLNNIYLSSINKRALQHEYFNIEVELMFGPSEHGIDPGVFTSDKNINFKVIYVNQTGNIDLSDLNLTAKKVKIIRDSATFDEDVKDDDILLYLKNYCSDVSDVEFNRSHPLHTFQNALDDSFINWFKSLTGLTSLTGPFTKRQLIDILSTCRIIELKVIAFGNFGSFDRYKDEFYTGKYDGPVIVFGNFGSFDRDKDEFYTGKYVGRDDGESLSDDLKERLWQLIHQKSLVKCILPWNAEVLRPGEHSYKLNE